MTPQELSSVLKDPNSITLSQVYELENIIYEFPFFQVARAVHLKVLYTQGSYRYNKALKITASHIGNRSVLLKSNLLCLKHIMMKQYLQDLQCM